MIHSISRDCLLPSVALSVNSRECWSSSLLCCRPNSLPDSLWDPALSSSSFRQLLKTDDICNRYSAHSAQ